MVPRSEHNQRSDEEFAFGDSVVMSRRNSGAFCKKASIQELGSGIKGIACHYVRYMYLLHTFAFYFRALAPLFHYVTP